MKVEQYIIDCLRSVICGEDISLPELDPEQQKKLYKTAVRQDLAHLVSYAMRKKGLPVEKEFSDQENLAVYRYTHQALALEEIGYLFGQEEIPYLPLKGSVLRGYYPEAWMRTSSDIDVLIQEKDFERAKKILTEKARFRFESGNLKDASFYRDECVHLELHRNLVRDKVQDVFLSEHVWEQVEWNGMHCTMPDELFYCFHIEHMLRHFETGGCGIRFFLDLWILNHRDGHDRVKREALLEQSGRKKFEETARHLSEVWFGGQEHTELTRKMEHFLFRAGVYGTIENWALVQEVQCESKVKSVLGRLWLPYEHLCWSYPELRGRKYLQPYYEGKRFFQMILDGRWKRSVKELTANRTVDVKKKEEMSRMLEELGLKQDTRIRNEK